MSQMSSNESLNIFTSIINNDGMFRTYHQRNVIRRRQNRQRGRQRIYRNHVRFIASLNIINNEENT
ncbi:6164_t:CDS:1, partial [Funneliformis caledonium]